MAETLVKCRCGKDMAESKYRGLLTCEHCDGAICPNFKQVSLTGDGCDNCLLLIHS